MAGNTIRHMIRRFRQLLAMPGLRQVGSNTGWLIFERLAGMAIRLFVVVWVVRYLGPEQFGAYTFALSFVFLFEAFASLGLDSIVVREIAKGGRDEGEILASSLAARLVASVVTLLVIAGAVILWEDSQTTRLAVVIVAGALIFKSANVIDLWFQAHLRSRSMAILRLGVCVLFSAMQIAFILLKLPLIAFLYLLLAESAVTAFLLGVLFHLIGPKELVWRPKLDVVQSLLRDAWPLMLSGVFVSIYMRIDEVMIRQLAGDVELGVYGAAARISEVFYFLPVAIGSSIFPVIVGLRQGASDEVYKRHMQTLYDGMVVLSYVLIIPMMLCSTRLISGLFGDNFLAAAPILRVHIWSFLFVSLGVAQSRWLVAENMTRFSMMSTVLGATTNLVMNAVLIPQFGGVGAAWSTLISYAVVVFPCCLLLSRLRPVFAQLTWSLLAPLRCARLLTSMWQLAAAAKIRQNEIQA